MAAPTAVLPATRDGIKLAACVNALVLANSGHGFSLQFYRWYQIRAQLYWPRREIDARRPDPGHKIRIASKLLDLLQDYSFVFNSGLPLSKLSLNELFKFK